MFKFLRKYKWYKNLTRKLYQHAHPWKTPTKWDLRFDGYSIVIYDMSYFGESEQIRIIENGMYDGRVFKYENDEGKKITVSYLINEYSHLPSIMRKRMREIFIQLDISDDSMDELKEVVDEFFGYENL